MFRSTPAVLVALVLSAPSPLFAGAEDIAVENAWSRASIGVSRPGAAYMTVRNTGNESVTLTGLSTDLAIMPEIHRSTTNEQGVSSMSPAGDLAMAPGETISLEPGGLHVMLMQLQRPMTEDDNFLLTLEFSDGGTVQVDVPILGIAARGPEE